MGWGLSSPPAVLKGELPVSRDQAFSWPPFFECLVNIFHQIITWFDSFIALNPAKILSIPVFFIFKTIKSQLIYSCKFNLEKQNVFEMKRNNDSKSF